MKRKIMGVVAVCVLMAIVLPSGAWGTALPPEVMASLKEVQILEITRDNVDVIWDLRANQHPNRADIVDLRVAYGDLSNELSTVLQEWTKSGKGIILYEYNVRRFLPQIEMSSEWEKLGHVVRAIEDSHPVVTGVEEVKFEYVYYKSAQRGLQASYIAILEAENGKIVSVVSPYGRGRLVALLNVDSWIGAPWPITEYDNERFKINVYQWLAGAPVPGVLGVGGIAGGRTAEVATQPKSALYDAVYLKNGDILSGTVLNEQFTITASYGTLAFPISDVAQILLEGMPQQGPGNIEQIVLRIGDKVSGVVQEEKINIKLASGAEVSLEKDKIASITFKVR